MVSIFIVLLLIGVIKCGLINQITRYPFFVILDKAMAWPFVKVVNND
jgi:hypothetical protein